MVNTASLAICASHSPAMNGPGQEMAGRVFRDGLAHAARLAAAFDPDLVVCFGGDHRNAFQRVIPSYTVVWDADALGDFGSPLGDYDIPRATAREVTEGLIEDGFDIAVASGVTLDHGFSQTLDAVVGGLGTKPVLPIFINCATAPLPTVLRTIQFGRALGQRIARLPGKVLYLASGGLSHTPPTLDEETRILTPERRAEMARLHMDTSTRLVLPAWDHKLLTVLMKSETDIAATVTDEFLHAGGTGANEVRNWLAAWAASGGEPLTALAYEPMPAWVTGMGVAVSAGAGVG